MRGKNIATNYLWGSQIMENRDWRSPTCRLELCVVCVACQRIETDFSRIFFYIIILRFNDKPLANVHEDGEIKTNERDIEKNWNDTSSSLFFVSCQATLKVTYLMTTPWRHLFLDRKGLQLHMIVVKHLRAARWWGTKNKPTKLIENS